MNSEESAIQLGLAVMSNRHIGFEDKFVKGKKCHLCGKAVDMVIFTRDDKGMSNWDFGEDTCNACIDAQMFVQWLK